MPNRSEYDNNTLVNNNGEQSLKQANIDGRINDFDLSKVEHDDQAPSDSEPLFNRNSISNSPTRNRKPIQNSQPKTNLQVDFANIKGNEAKLNGGSNS